MSFSKIVFHDLAAISSEVTCPNKHRIEGARNLLYGQKREPIHGQIMLKTDVTDITVCCEHCGMKPDFSIHNLNMQIN